MKKWILLIGESILLVFTFSLLEASYSIYWGDALAGTFGGLIFVFLGWVPGLIGLILFPFNIFLSIMIVKEFKRLK